MSLQNYIDAYNAYFRLACKIAYDIVKDSHLAGDVAQELFTEMFQKKDRLNYDLAKYWIIIHAHYRAIDFLRKPYRRRETDFYSLDLPEPVCSIEAEALTLRREQAHYQFSALTALKSYNKKWYDILIRCHVYDESYRNMAEDYGITVDNLRVQIWRARKWLAKKVQELYGE